MTISFIFAATFNHVGTAAPLIGVVRRAASRPISIIRSTSVPAQLQDRSQQGVSGVEGGSSGNANASGGRRPMHVRDRSLQHDFNSGVAVGVIGVAQSLPIPQAPLLAGSLPPSRFLDDLPPLSLGPQVRSQYLALGLRAMARRVKCSVDCCHRTAIPCDETADMKSYAHARIGSEAESAALRSSMNTCLVVQLWHLR